jgi:hypothetical protein
MKSIRDYMICWTPDRPFNAGNSTRGNAALFLHPDRHRASRPYTSTAPAPERSGGRRSEGQPAQL